MYVFFLGNNSSKQELFVNATNEALYKGIIAITIGKRYSYSIKLELYSVYDSVFTNSRKHLS